MADAEQKKADAADDEPIIIKKYANRRLYNTATSSYVTLDHLAQMVKDGAEFVVYDAKSGDDITRSVLTHIIVEEEAKGVNLLPISFLRHLISFYGDSLQAVVPNYLEHSMQAFAHNQEQMRAAVEQALHGFNPFGQFEELNKQNMTMFENAVKMFAPFYPEEAAKASGVPGPQAAAAREAEGIDDMRARLEAMQAQLDALSKSREK